MAERWRLAVVLVTAALLAVSGCANVPTSGDLEVGDEGQRDDIPPALPHVEVPGPEPGASAEEIVGSFVDAMVTYEAGYTAAKQYLTDSAAASWDPTVVQIARYQIGTTPGGLSLQYTITGKIVDGTYMPVPQEDIEYRLSLTRVDGEWRITNPPEGMIMSEADFERDFSLYNRYYWDPSFSFLVPDPVYLPTGRRSKIQTLLTNALLDGPSDALEPGVRTAFPQGTELTANTAPVDESTAFVDLSQEASQATRELREQMAAQLAWTLTEVVGVVDVLPTAAGSLLYTEEPVTRTEFKSLGASDLTKAPSTPLYGVTDSGLSMVDGEGLLSAVDGPLGDRPGLTDVAINPRTEQAVAVDSNGSELLMADLEPGAELHTIFEGTSLSSLAWDPAGLIWAIDTDSEGSHIVALTAEGNSVPVEIPGQDGRTVDALAVSPDGTRLAVVLDGVAEIRTIVRANGAPGPAELINRRVIARSVLDVAWSDGTTLALLTNPAGQSPRPERAGLTRDTEQFDPVEGAVSIAAASGQIGGGLVVASDDGLLTPIDSGSTESLPAMRAPTYPG